MICKYARNRKEKSKSIKNNETEVIYELTIFKQNELLEQLKKFHFTQINFLSHDGEFRF